MQEKAIIDHNQVRTKTKSQHYIHYIHLQSQSIWIYMNKSKIKKYKIMQRNAIIGTLRIQ